MEIDSDERLRHSTEFYTQAVFSNIFGKGHIEQSESGFLRRDQLSSPELIVKKQLRLCSAGHLSLCRTPQEALGS